MFIEVSKRVIWKGVLKIVGSSVMTKDKFRQVGSKNLNDTDVDFIVDKYRALAGQFTGE
jgi:hypothetical protein